MNKRDLSELTERSIELIQSYLDKEDKTINALAVEAGVHPTQLWLFMRRERGLTTSSLEKIGKAITKRP